MKNNGDGWVTEGNGLIKLSRNCLINWVKLG